jgi:VanZ family protein
VFDRRFFLKYWLPVLLWMSLIFVGSTDLLSGSRTARFLAPILHWLFPHLAASGLDQMQFIIRKLGHLTEYAILALLIWRLINHYQFRTLHPRLEIQAIQAWVLATIYAVTDEYHQSFYRSRFASPWDVAIDATGAMIALVAVWWLGKWRRWW